MQENPLIPDEHNDEKTTKNSMKTMIPTRDTDDLPMKKKNFNSDEQNLVTIELVQVLHSKQSRIDELEKRLKDVEEQESQWRVNSSFSYDFVVKFFVFLLFHRKNTNKRSIVVKHYKIELFN